MRTITENTNSIEAQIILDLVNKFGCIAKEQIPSFMPVDEKRPNRDYSSLINFLITSGQVKEDENMICSKRTMARNRETIDTIWVMLELIEKSNGDAIQTKDEQAREAFVGEKPEPLSFILDGTTVCKIVPVYSSQDVSRSYLLQEQFYKTHSKGEESSVPVIYYFVLRDTDRLKGLSGFNLTLNHKICLLSGDLYSRPNIKILSPKK